MAKIKFRRDTAADWAQVNPVLAQGEPGFEYDTGLLKIGDGGTAWNSLPYSNTGGSGNALTNTDGVNSYSVGVNESGVVTMTTARGGLEFGAMPEPGAPQHLHIMRPTGQEGSTDLYFGDDYNYVKMPSSSYDQQGVEIGSSLNEGAVHTWRFGTDGSLSFPGSSNARIGEDEPGLVVRSGAGVAVLTNANNVNTYEVEFIGYIHNGFGDAPGATLTVTEIVAGTITNGMTIYGDGLPPEGWVVTVGSVPNAGTGGIGNYELNGANLLTASQSFNNNVLAAGSNAWVFENNGGITFPDNTVQTTAWTGSVSLISSGPTAPGSAVVAGTSDIDFNFSDGVSTAVSITRDSEIVSAKSVGLTLASNFDVKIVTDFTDNNRTWTFNGTDGSITFPDSTVQTTAYVSNKVSGTWTVTPGTANYSFTVPINGVYQLWARANIPNGIVSYVATAAVTNANVPVLGTQYAWNYTAAGDPILFTALPTQFVGTEGAISTANPASGTTTNTFVFGLANSTAENITVAYGYTKIS